MRRIYVAVAITFMMCGNKEDQETVTGARGEVFYKRVVASNLSDPWEITYGPDNFLWVTEAKGYKVSRINPVDGTKKVLLDLNSAKNFSRDGGNPWPQGGLMGMALHPKLLAGKPYVYLGYVHNFKATGSGGKGCAENFGGCFFTTRIVRYTYDRNTDSLTSPEVLCDTIPGSNDHNGGRLLVSAVGDKEYLFYSTGEMGAGQFNNAGRTNHAQNVSSYEGKILRFNTEADNDNTGFDKWIPNDNPFNSSGQSAVWSYGHRNPQGLASMAGRLYSVEHGPYSDDEVNLVEKGKNYGHPVIVGYNDGNYNGLAAGATDHEQLPGAWHTLLTPLYKASRRLQ